MYKFVLISKDAMCRDYLPVYGNRAWKTPNIDALAEQGTTFMRHYTAAPSTVMSFFSAITGRFAHETEYQMYEKIHDIYRGETLFSKLKAKGIHSHIVWDKAWSALPKYFDCYRNDVQIHELETFRQGVGAHYIHDGYLSPDEQKKQRTLEMVYQVVKDILETEEDTFLWIHFPHVINGEVAYGSDIELFDSYVGMIRQFVPDDCIAITADHGNMNGHKGKIGYGFDVDESAIRVPLITPRKQNLALFHGLTSTVDLYDLLFSSEIPEREIIYSDSAYRAQKHRKLAIIQGDYKYVYNKKTASEELYDLRTDPNEQISIINDYCFDPDRKVNAPLRELYYYPAWNKLPDIRAQMRAEKERIWKNGSLDVVIKSSIKEFLKPFYKRLTRKRMRIV